MAHYALAVFEPELEDSSCVVHYYCCYHETADVLSEFPDECVWYVPGTLDLAA